MHSGLGVQMYVQGQLVVDVQGQLVVDVQGQLGVNLQGQLGVDVQDTIIKCVLRAIHKLKVYL